ncbi:Crp/Fnr family transcriptional regulator [Agrobacterium sp. fls2-241-TYG-188a]|uniref:Crp/Fnr family transcriptional regulator n=1 Tax=Agrobacterium sp. fls2-241-TYG-188a TaxID=3040275 RepID=UPI00254ADC49|nr:Crp/Fnr family transcriptional regulator [Agrobacterium sp. fls2-241-TYG-188a]
MTWTNNGLLRTLPEKDAALVRSRAELVTLDQDQTLFESKKPITNVYFFESGLSSEVVFATKSIEVGCIGHEGCSGVPVLLGVDSSPHKAFMQAGGTALRIASADLTELIDTNRAIRELLLRYAHVFMIQIAATALADGRYDIEQRLARWLLMCQDRLGDELPLTHDFLSVMLGVRRPSVTDALHKLEGNRAIRAERALITVRDRAALEEKAGDSYGIPEAEYRRLISHRENAH